MMLILNRLRGMNGVWSKFNGLLLALIVQIAFGNPYVSVAVGLGYIIGESFGWGEWVGNLTGDKSNTLSHESEEGRTNGIYWLVSKFLDPFTNWILFCRIALGIRGFYWAILTFLPLLLVNVSIFYIIGVSLFLGISFPLACELGKRTFEKGYVFKFLDFQTAWNLQEGWYGLAWDIAILGTILWAL